MAEKQIYRRQIDICTDIQTTDKLIDIKIADRQIYRYRMLDEGIFYIK